MEKLSPDEQQIWSVAFLKQTQAQATLNMLIEHFVQKYQLQDGDTIRPDGSIIRIEKKEQITKG